METRTVNLRIKPYLASICILVLVAIGCRRLPVGYIPFIPPPPVLEVPVSNPTNVGNVDPDFLWRMIVDAVDDHFRIDVEQPVRKDSQNWLEGRLKTYPEISGTSFEPWRTDTARGFEKLQSTFQTIRRTATVQVIPEATGFQIAIEVLKEQEDVDQSQYSAAGAASQRHDGGIIRQTSQLRQLPVTLGWIAIGRDRDLEQRLMASILGRITDVEPPPARLFN